MIDYHLHSSFSNDGNEKIYDICQKANELGLKHIAITDHLDFDDTFKQQWDIEDVHGEEGYVTQIKKAREDFPGLNIAIGAEGGYTPTGNSRLLKRLEQINPDFVIGSLHFIDGVDPYDKSFFEGRTKSEAYSFYFETLYDSIEHIAKYANVVGHLTYVAKSPKMPYNVAEVVYSEYSNIFDDILKRTIEFGLGIEINTSGLDRKVGQLLPPFEVVKRYKELGGEILTVGSDAHYLKYIGSGIDKAIDAAREAGFKYLTIYPNGKEEKIKIV